MLPLCGRNTKSLRNNQMPPQHSSWWELYVKICEQRRARRLETIRSRAPQIVFTKRRTIQPSFFAYTEAQSDAQNERHFRPNSVLCLWTMDAGVLAGQGVRANSSPNIRTLLTDPEGVIRDPAVSWDARRVLFAWKKSLDEDDYHLYELNAGRRPSPRNHHRLGFRRLRTSLPAQRRHRLRLNPLRSDGRLLVDRGQQSLHLRRRRPLPPPAWFRSGAHRLPAGPR